MLDGTVPLNTDQSANMVYDVMVEINFLRSDSENLPSEPLFESNDQAISYLKMGQIGDSIKRQFSYFHSCQQNDEAIKLIHDLKAGIIDKTDSRIDALRRVDRLAKTLIDREEALFLKDGLVFHLAFPKRRERHRVAVLLNLCDAKRFFGPLAFLLCRSTQRV